MKTKKINNKLAKFEREIETVLNTPIHVRMEYFFRKRYVLLAVMALMSIAMAKSDGGFLGNMRDAYHYGYGRVGSYLRNETVHMPHVTSPAKVVVASSK